MRIHAARDLEAYAWADTSSARTAERVQFRVGVTRYSATADEARQFAAELLKAADAVERAAGEDA